MGLSEALRGRREEKAAPIRRQYAEIIRKVAEGGGKIDAATVSRLADLAGQLRYTDAEVEQDVSIIQSYLNAERVAADPGGIRAKHAKVEGEAKALEAERQKFLASWAPRAEKAREALQQAANELASIDAAAGGMERLRELNPRAFGEGE